MSTRPVPVIKTRLTHRAWRRAVEISFPDIEGSPRFLLHCEIAPEALKAKIAAAAIGTGGEHGLYFGGSRRVGSRTREHYATKWIEEGRGRKEEVQARQRRAKRSLELSQSGKAEGGAKRQRAQPAAPASGGQGAQAAAEPAAPASGGQGSKAGILVHVYYSSLNRRPDDRQSVRSPLAVQTEPATADHRACAV